MHSHNLQYSISIHASLTGCDQRRNTTRMAMGRFQSTHPSRDATSHILSLTKAQTISIHASLTGCDTIGTGVTDNISLFQSTHPSRDATFETIKNNRHLIFQSTHPSRDATTVPFLNASPSAISIHASLTGCDFICIE